MTSDTAIVTLPKDYQQQTVDIKLKFTPGNYNKTPPEIIELLYQNADNVLVYLKHDNQKQYSLCFKDPRKDFVSIENLPVGQYEWVAIIADTGNNRNEDMRGELLYGRGKLTIDSKDEVILPIDKEANLTCEFRITGLALNLKDNVLHHVTLSDQTGEIKQGTNILREGIDKYFFYTSESKFWRGSLLNIEIVDDDGFKHLLSAKIDWVDLVKNNFRTVIFDYTWTVLPPE